MVLQNKRVVVLFFLLVWDSAESSESGIKSYLNHRVNEHPSPHHLLEDDLHQVFDSFIRVLLGGLSDQAVFQHVKHLLPGDVVVTVQVIHMKTIWAAQRRRCECWDGRVNCHCVTARVGGLHWILSSKVPRRKTESPTTHSLTLTKLSLSLSNVLKTGGQINRTIIRAVTPVSTLTTDSR